MMKKWLFLLVVLPGLLLASCRSTAIVGEDSQILHPVVRIGTSPSGGDTADLVANQLNGSEGGSIHALTTQETLTILKELGVPSVRASTPENLKLLRSRGLDAYLRIEMRQHVVSEDPDSIDVKLFSTHDSAQRIAFVWHNARGGMKGSPADATMRKDQAEAAREITAELLRRLAPYVSANN